jgi:tetraspanin-13/31
LKLVIGKTTEYSLFQLVGILLISVGVYGRAASIVTNLPIIGGILACGIILIIISVMGLIGAVKHHQVILFFVSFHRLSI